MCGNFTLSFGRLRQIIVLKCVPHVQHDYFSSFNQSDHCYLALLLPLPLSLLELPVILRGTSVHDFAYCIYGYTSHIPDKIVPKKKKKKKRTGYVYWSFGVDSWFGGQINSETKNEISCFI